MTLVVKQNETSRPLNGTLLCGDAAVLHPATVSDSVQEVGFCGLLFGSVSSLCYRADYAHRVLKNQRVDGENEFCLTHSSWKILLGQSK